MSKGHERFSFNNFRLPPAASRNKGLQFVPHVLAVMTNQQIQLFNEDTFLVNWHLHADTNPVWNLALPPSKSIRV